MATLQEYNETTSREKRFEALYTEANRVGIRRRILFLLHGANSDQVEDLEQTTWLKVWRNLTDGPRQPVSFLWVSTIATRVVIDFLRYTYVMQRQGQKVARSPIASLDAEWGTYEEIEVTGDFTVRVSDRDEAERALATMPDRISLAFRLRAAGYSFGDMAALTHYSYSGLSDILHRTRLRVQQEREEMASWK